MILINQINSFFKKLNYLKMLQIQFKIILIKNLTNLKSRISNLELMNWKMKI